jgi:hypothetical protein
MYIFVWRFKHYEVIPNDALDHWSIMLSTGFPYNMQTIRPQTHFLLIKSKIQPFEFDTSPHVGQDWVHVLITRLSICFTVSEYKWIPKYVVITNLERVESFKENV